MIGIDSSPAMLAKARAGAAKAGVRLDLREGDMRDLALDEPAGLIYCPYRGGTSSLWWATKNEWLGLLDVAGLEVAALYGGFAGEPFTDESREYVFVARHRAAAGHGAATSG